MVYKLISNGMKVILLQDVAKIGRRYETAEVPTGYAMNKLIPSGMAEAATTENAKKIAALKNRADNDKTNVVERFDQAIALLEGKSVVVSVPANPQGHFFEALKPATIIGAIAGFGAVIDENQLTISAPIKEAGEYEIELHEGDRKEKLTITVSAAEVTEE